MKWPYERPRTVPGMLIEAKKAIQNKIASWLPMAEPGKHTKPEATKDTKEVKSLKAEAKDPEPAKDAKDAKEKPKDAKAAKPKENKLSKFLLATESEITSHLQVRMEL